MTRRLTALLGLGQVTRDGHDGRPVADLKRGREKEINDA